MENLFTEEELKEEVYKCSKCALCRSVCPPFIETKDETTLARGKCVILNAVFQGKLKITENFIKKLDMCANCNKCQEICPSAINIEKVARSAIYLYYKKHPIQKLFLFKQKNAIRTTKV